VKRNRSHVDGAGAARMVDVSAKAVTARTAGARGRVELSAAAMRVVRAGKLAKGAVTEVARIAGVRAAMRTHEASPVGHPVALSHVDVDVTARGRGVDVEARVRTEARTGAEMEALHAVAVAALTVYDMVKAVDKGMTISAIRLVQKTGGTSTSGAEFTSATRGGVRGVRRSAPRLKTTTGGTSTSGAEFTSATRGGVRGVRRSAPRLKKTGGKSDFRAR
jgi:cyclic pyranopterin phosphate synthase